MRLEGCLVYMQKNSPYGREKNAGADDKRVAWRAAGSDACI